MSRRYLGIAFLLGSTLSIILAPSAEAVPSFSRQTGMACDACHTSYPGLTKLGREFKLNGYQMDGLAQVSSSSGTASPGMSINKIPNLSVILKAGEEGMNRSIANTQNPSADFPKELGLYYAGRIAPHLGTFLDVSYSAGSGSLGMDNADLRYARTTQLFSKTTIWGLDLDNSPTLEDVWNSTPAWGWPYVHNIAPVGPSGPFIGSGAVGGNTLGIGGYQYWNGLVYTYFGIFQAAPQGNTPANYANGAAISGAAPYYRIAFTPINNFEIGSFGFFSNFHPSIPGAPLKETQHYSDIGVDSQYQWFPNSSNTLTFHATYIHQLVSGLDKTVPSYSGSDSLTTNFFNIDGNWYYQHRYGVGVGFFYSHGDRSSYYNTRYQDLSGNNFTDGMGYRPSSRPDTNGETAQLYWFPWQNVRLALSYIAYNKFNGAVNNYDGHGRNASDNNTWVLNALFGF